MSIAGDRHYVPAVLDVSVAPEHAWVHGGMWYSAVSIYQELK